MKQIGRALLLRCPNCGQGRMFRAWVKSLERCSSCGFRFDRGESDYFIGAYTLNLIIAELLVVAVFVGAMFAMWPAVPWQKLTYALVALAVVGPLVTYPFSKSIWLAIDLSFRPREPTDLGS